MGDAILDKNAVGRDMRQFHIGVAPGEVSTVALLPGDPFRVPLIAEHLSDVRDVAHKREHRTMVGTYQGRQITATSTGMGCPSTAIAAEELARVGVTSMIRVGSTAALQPGINPGDLIVSQGSFRNDGTSDAYVPKGYPAVPDLEITLRLEQEARELGRPTPTSPCTLASMSPMTRSTPSPRVDARMSALGLLNVEMESSALFVVARQRGLRAGMICAVSSNLVEGASVYDTHDRLAAGWHHSIEVALRTAVALSL